MTREAAPLTPETEQRLRILFEGWDAEEAARLLVSECGNNLPFLEHFTPEQLERFRFAALKVSGGDLGTLREAVALAKQDWRDLLVWAGFARDADIHEKWRP